MLRLILNLISTLFFEASSLSQTQRSQIWLLSLGSLLWDPLFLPSGARIIGEPSYLPDIHMGAGDSISGLLTCRSMFTS